MCIASFRSEEMRWLTGKRPLSNVEGKEYPGETPVSLILGNIVPNGIQNT